MLMDVSFTSFLYLKISFLILGNHPRQSLGLTLGLPIMYIDRWTYQVLGLFSSCCIGKYYENRIFPFVGMKMQRLVWFF